MENLRKKNDQEHIEIVHVFEKYHHSMSMFGSGISKDREVIQDCIQDLFLKFCENHDLILNAKNQEAYLKASLRRQILNTSRRDSKLSAKSSILLEIAVPSYEDMLIKKQKTLQDSLKIKEALSQLTKSQKTILTLRFYRSMSYEDIADKLAISKRTVYNQVYDSMKKLKNILPR